MISKIQRIIVRILVPAGVRLRHISFHRWCILPTYEGDELLLVSACVEVVLCCVHQVLLITLDMYFNPLFFLWHTGVPAFKHRRHAWNITGLHHSEFTSIIFLVLVNLHSELLLRKSLPVNLLGMLVSLMCVVSKLRPRFFWYFIALECTHLTILVINHNIWQQFARRLFQSRLLPILEWLVGHLLRTTTLWDLGGV